MLKKPNLTTEEKTRLKDEILGAIDGEKKPSPKVNFAAPIIIEAAAEKNKINIENKIVPKIEEKEIKEHRPKQQKSFVVMSDIKIREKDRYEKHRPNQGLSLLRFIILLLIIIVALLVANLFMLAK